MECIYAEKSQEVCVFASCSSTLSLKGFARRALTPFPQLGAVLEAGCSRVQGSGAFTGHCRT